MFFFVLSWGSFGFLCSFFVCVCVCVLCLFVVVYGMTVPPVVYLFFFPHFISVHEKAISTDCVRRRARKE